MDGTARHAEYHSQCCCCPVVGRAVTIFSTRYLLLLLLWVPKYATQHLYLLPSVWPSTLLPFFGKNFLKPFFLFKKMKGEKNFLLIFLCVESKERRVPETISAAAGGGGWWMMDWLLKWFSEKERKNWKSNCFPDISNNVADPLTISWWWLSAVVMWLVIELVNKSASSSASLSLLFSNRIYYV